MTTEIIAEFNGRVRALTNVSSNTKDKQQLLASLLTYAKEFLETNYGLSLDITIKLDARLGTSMGKFTYIKSTNLTTKVTTTTARDIRINTKFMTLAMLDGQRGMTNILEVLKHELVHYALFTLGKPSHDGDDYFEQELARLGIPSTQSIAYRLTYLDNLGNEYKYNNWDTELKTLRIRYYQK